jgi:hypothetical protein
MARGDSGFGKHLDLLEPPRSGSEQGNIGMTSESIGGVAGAIVGAAVLVAAIVYGPIGQFGKPAKPVEKIEAPKAPVPATPAVRGPVVREVPQ